MISRLMPGANNPLVPVIVLFPKPTIMRMNPNQEEVALHPRRITGSVSKFRWLLSVIVAGLICATKLMAQDVPSSSTPLPLNPIALSVPLAPQAIAASDGRTHLTWEVQVVNLTDAALPVQSIGIWPDGSEHALLEHKAGDVDAHMSTVALWSKNSSEIGASGASTIWLDLALEPGVSVPVTIETRVAVTGKGITGEDATTRVRVATDATPPRVLHPPLAGKLWGVFEACCAAANHHRRGQRSVDGHFVLPERYAIDFIQLDKNAEPYTGSDINEHYLGFGKPVLAVADATVVDVYDELADVKPHAAATPPSLPKAGGNHVILDLGGGVWAMYGHLKAHSIRVKVGDRVKSGDVVAELGNNGNSDMPHLHFQLMNTRNFALSQGLPFVFDCYELVGHTDAEGNHIVANDRPTMREKDLPLTLSIVNFPEARLRK